MQAVDRYPVAGKRKALPLRRTQLLILRNRDGQVLLQQRPDNGIWGGLWSLPELDVEASASQWCMQNGLNVLGLAQWPTLRHTFTHYHLDIHPLLIDVAEGSQAVMDGDTWLWYKDGHTRSVGLAAPVRKLLDRLNTDTKASPET
jgi:A/G-specific adenine glycosylase